MPPPARTGSRSRLVALLALTGLLSVGGAAFAQPVAARTCGPLTIESGTVSPATGTTATSFTFRVSIQDNSGAKPAWVRVRVANTWTDMTTTGTRFKSGVVYAASRSLPAGTWDYWFRAERASGDTCDHTLVAPASVTVTVPSTPKPTATPTPKPKPTATPTPKPPKAPAATP